MTGAPALSTARSRRAEVEARLVRLAPWALPLVIAYLAGHWSTRRQAEVIGAVVAAAVVVVAVRHPGGALVALVVFLPLQTVGFGLLLHLHVPAGLLRPLGGTKELLGACILIAAVRELAAGRRRLGRLDAAALAYVGVVTAYLLAPGLFSPYVTHHFGTRLLAWRADCGYVLVLVACRHAPIDARARRRVVQVLAGVAVLVAGFGLWQLASPHGLGHFVLTTGDAARFQEQVLHVDPVSAAQSLQYVTQTAPLRVSSLFLSPFDMADFYVVVFAVFVEQVARDRRSPVPLGVCALAVVMVFASRVRADGLAVLVVALLALSPAPSRPTAARLRLIGALLVGALVVVPSLSGTRFVGAQGGSVSSAQHVREVDFGILVIAHHPLGLGIGNAPGTASRFSLYAALGGQAGSYVSDNSVTQVGDELGVQALVPWLVLVGGALVAARRAARSGGPLEGGAWLALVGVAVAGQYHHVFLTYPVPWTLWALAGLATRSPGPHGTTDD